MIWVVCKTEGALPAVPLRAAVFLSATGRAVSAPSGRGRAASPGVFAVPAIPEEETGLPPAPVSFGSFGLLCVTVVVVLPAVAFGVPDVPGRGIVVLRSASAFAPVSAMPERGIVVLCSPLVVEAVPAMPERGIDVLCSLTAFVPL